MRQTLTVLDNESLAFPPTQSALSEPNGLLAIGGDLSPNRIISAYTAGIFPWFSQGDPYLWWSPDPRAVIFIKDFRINKTLKKFLKKTTYKVSLNKAFSDVIRLCADAPFRDEETWILPKMVKSYEKLHQQGHAHSIEVWDNEVLIGGLYGIAINGHFSGESMFYRKTNASKVALIALANLLSDLNIAYIDCQLLNPFLADMGCVEITRDEFISLKDFAINSSIESSFWTPRFL